MVALDGNRHFVLGTGQVGELVGAEISGKDGDRRGQASALGELGVVWRMTGDYLAAASCWSRP